MQVFCDGSNLNLQKVGIKKSDIAILKLEVQLPVSHRV